MLRSIILALAPLVLVTSAATAGLDEIRPRFDVSALEAFWRVADQLQRDLSPPEAEWDQLFETSAYRALCAAEYSPHVFRQHFEIALKPSLRAQGDALERGDRQMGPYVRHFREVMRRRSAVERAVDEMVRGSLSDSYLRAVRELLPATLPADRPRIAFAVFSNDGRGYEPIVIDPLALISWDVPPFLAHEIHHWFHNRLQRVEVETVPASDRELVRALVTIQFEGIGDLIDKHAWVTDPASVEPARRQYVQLYLQNIGETPRILSETERELAAWMNASDAAGRQAAGHNLRHLLPMGGHPTGYVLARAIIEGSGRPALVATLGNPFAFLRAAADAGARLDPPRKGLGESARAALDLLERTYISASKGASGE